MIAAVRPVTAQWFLQGVCHHVICTDYTAVTISYWCILLTWIPENKEEVSCHRSPSNAATSTAPGTNLGIIHVNSGANPISAKGSHSGEQYVWQLQAWQQNPSSSLPPSCLSQAQKAQLAPMGNVDYPLSAEDGRGGMWQGPKHRCTHKEMPELVYSDCAAYIIEAHRWRGQWLVTLCRILMWTVSFNNILYLHCCN